MKRISIQQPIINAIDETDASLARFQNQMMKWAKYIEKEIGAKNAYKYKAKLFTVDGCTIDLPDDCYHVAMVLPGDYTDQCNARYINTNWATVRQDDTHEDEYYSWLWRPAESTYVLPYLWEEIADQLNMLSDFDSVDMTLIYQYIETDENNFWRINENHSDAITKFIKFKMAGKYNWKINKSDKLLRASHIQFVKDLERDYNIAIRHARALDSEASPYETIQY